MSIDWILIDIHLERWCQEEKFYMTTFHPRGIHPTASVFMCQPLCSIAVILQGIVAHKSSFFFFDKSFATFMHRLFTVIKSHYRYKTSLTAYWG